MESNEQFLREISREEWSLHWNTLQKTNMIQSWEYGEAKELTSHWKPLRFIIEDSNKTPIALAQFLVFSIPFLGSVARLNRGPLKINLEASSDNEVLDLNMIKAINAEASKRWWLLFIAPEINKNSIKEDKLISLGLRPRKVTSWGSEVISLEKFDSNEELLASLNGKWRNMLRKSQKSSLILERHVGKDSPIDQLKENYKKIQLTKGFEGLSLDFLEQIILTKGKTWKANIYTANKESKEGDGNFDGMLVNVTHGNSSTYLVGYTNSSGRSSNANYLLLWQAILDAKEEGVEFFDLGGLNENTPEGIARFKRGLQAEHYDLIGEYLKLFYK